MVFRGWCSASQRTLSVTPEGQAAPSTRTYPESQLQLAHAETGSKCCSPELKQFRTTSEFLGRYCSVSRCACRHRLVRCSSVSVTKIVSGVVTAITPSKEGFSSYSSRAVVTIPDKLPATQKRVQIQSHDLHPGNSSSRCSLHWTRTSIA